MYLLKNKKQKKIRKLIWPKISRFPPMPPKDKLLHRITTGFCTDTHPSQFEEAGWVVCSIF
ncbi:hypothetical protein L208DRAFT_1260809 [Tricholoma matsutake]|nr:hypothetical protein L208DRAFT_1260809 [Tricholoma matsutake 945]